MTRSLLALLCAVALAAGTASAAPAGALAGLEAGSVALEAGPPAVVAIGLWGGTGINDIIAHVREKTYGDVLFEGKAGANGYDEYFLTLGQRIYVGLFVLQFLLLGLTMVVKGPFAIASYRPIHALNPFANFFFFLLAGTLGYLLVANPGWVEWVYGWFDNAGQYSGCQEDVGITFLGASIVDVNACSAQGLSDIGMRMSSVIAVLSESSGNSPGNPFSWLAGAGGASTSVFAAYTALAIQLAVTQIAFVVVIAAAPLFFSAIVFRPFSGVADGFVSLIAYLGVKLFLLKLIAGVSGFVAERWFTAILTAVVSNALGLGDVALGGAFGLNLSVITASLLLLSLAMFLPTKVASMVSQRMNTDLNGILFRGEFPIQIH